MLFLGGAGARPARLRIAPFGQRSETSVSRTRLAPRPVHLLAGTRRWGRRSQAAAPEVRRRDTVVAGAAELDIRSKPLPNGVRHEGNAAVAAVGDGAVERAAQGDEPRHRGVDIGDDEV